MASFLNRLLFPAFLMVLHFAVPTLFYLVLGLLGLYLFWHIMWRLRLRHSYYTATLPADVEETDPSKKSRKLRVAVIGAGASGLVATKELVENGHTVVVFEKYAKVGGVFLYDKDKGGVYDSTTLTISNYTMAFSDFFTPGDSCRFWKHHEYYQYLVDYAAHFQIATKASLFFNTTVQSMQRKTVGLGGDGAGAGAGAGGQQQQQWEIVTSGEHAGTFYFDAVAVCNGTHQFPRIPTYLGQEASSIKICHSETYKNAATDARFVGRKVISVGAGETGADLAAEVAEVASKAMLSTRKAPFVIPRYPWNLGMPGDAFSTRAMFYCNHKYIMALHSQDQSLKAATSNKPFFQRVFKGAMGLGDPVMGKIAELADKSGGGVTDQFLTKNEAFVRSILAGKLHEKPDIVRLEGANTVVFADGSKEENVDTILLCTGYVDRFPFLKGHEVPSVRSLYKHAFHPDLGDSVAFIGFTRPGTGGVPPCAEMVARYFALICSGQRKLPDNWTERAAHEQQMEENLLRLSAHRVRSLLMYGDFMEAMAQHIGCAPNMLHLLLTDPLFFLKVMYAPMVGAQYRLRGPGSNESHARRVIEGAPTPTPLPFRVAQGVMAIFSMAGGALLDFRAPSW